MKWLRVMELTEKMIPHHHLMIGPIEGEIRCHGPSIDIRQYRRRFDSCACLSHRLARVWKAVTHDSYVVHSTPVFAGEGAGSYMGKYLGKTFGMEGRMEALGMARRWSTSRGFPKWDLGLKNKEWVQIMHHPGFGSVEEAGDAELLERDGSDIVKEIAARRSNPARKYIRKAGKHVAYDSP